MRRRSIWIALAVAIVAAMLIGLYVSAWQTALATAESVAMARVIEPLGPTDLTTRNALGQPVADNLIVTTQFSKSSVRLPEMSFEFVLANRASSMSKPVELGVTVRITPSGWVPAGYGSGG